MRNGLAIALLFSMMVAMQPANAALFHKKHHQATNAPHCKLWDKIRHAKTCK